MSAVTDDDFAPMLAWAKSRARSEEARQVARSEMAPIWDKMMRDTDTDMVYDTEALDGQGEKMTETNFPSTPDGGQGDNWLKAAEYVAKNRHRLPKTNGYVLPHKEVRSGDGSATRLKENPSFRRLRAASLKPKLDASSIERVEADYARCLYWTTGSRFEMWIHIEFGEALFRFGDKEKAKTVLLKAVRSSSQENVPTDAIEELLAMGVTDPIAAAFGA